VCQKKRITIDSNKEREREGKKDQRRVTREHVDIDIPKLNMAEN
jgi:hypothetical protein